MILERLPSSEEVARGTADAVARAIDRRKDARIVLPAGGTPVPVYAELVRRCQASELDLSAAHLVQLDELVGVPQDDPRSFCAFLRTHLLDRIERVQGRDHLLNGGFGHPKEEAARHAAALATLGGADLVLLGLGQNGHVAFNEPGSDVAEGARVVKLHDATIDSIRSAFPDGSEPLDGLTLGLREIVAGRDLVMIVTGTSKAAILTRLLQGTVDAACPASLILSHPSLRILADFQAAPDWVSETP